MRNMKGFLNKNAKIMWENTPAQPEFTSDKIVAAVAAGSEELFDNEDFQEGLASAVTDIVGDDIKLEDLKNVGGGTLQSGKMLMYNGSESRWEYIEPIYPRYWSAASTVTVTSETEGTTIRVPISVQSGYACFGFFVRCNLAQAASGAGGSFGIVAEFDTSGTPVRRSIGDLTTSIVDTGTGVICGMYSAPDASLLYTGWMTQRSASVSGNTNMTFRPDCVYKTSSLSAPQLTTIEFRTQTSGCVIPAGTTFEIWLLSGQTSFYL